MPTWQVVTDDGLLRPAQKAERGKVYCGGSARQVNPLRLPPARDRAMDAPLQKNGLILLPPVLPSCQSVHRCLWGVEVEGLPRPDLWA